MIKINCKTDKTLKLVDMVPFQGNLKKRTDKDIADLSESLVTEGLMMPFAIWVHDDKNYLLDGHGRKEALVKLAMDNPELLSEDWPVVLIEADTEDNARKALLQISSQYGKVTKTGVKQFCATIPDYKAPVIKKFVADKKPVVKKPLPQDSKVVLKIRVPKDMLDQVKEILGQVKYIEVL